jgi:hypothetical protein
LESKFKFENIPDLIQHYETEKIPYAKATVTLSNPVA